MIIIKSEAMLFINTLFRKEGLIYFNNIPLFFL